MWKSLAEHKSSLHLKTSPHFLACRRAASCDQPPRAASLLIPEGLDASRNEECVCLDPSCRRPVDGGGVAGLTLLTVLISSDFSPWGTLCWLMRKGRVGGVKTGARFCAGSPTGVATPVLGVQ